MIRDLYFRSDVEVRRGILLAFIEMYYQILQGHSIQTFCPKMKKGAFEFFEVYKLLTNHKGQCNLCSLIPGLQPDKNKCPDFESEDTPHILNLEIALLYKYNGDGKFFKREWIKYI
jgi:hypothetical protein